MIDIRKFTETLQEKPVAVFGLGVSNLAVMRALAGTEVKFAAFDDDPEKCVAAAHEGYTIKDLAREDLSSYACLVLAPGVAIHYPEPHLVVRQAQKAGLEILCDIEILHRCRHGRLVVGITGTNGKSTTTALAGHILDSMGQDVAVGGNIGRAALAIDMPSANGMFVLELSSYQMDLCPTFRPDISVHLNLSPDHIDHHGSVEAYYKAKEKICDGPGSAIIGIDDAWSEKMFHAARDRGVRAVYPVSVGQPVAGGVYILNGGLYDGMFGPPEKMGDIDASALPGLHNHQNAAAAYAVARLRDIAPDRIMAALKTYPGLPHRQALIRVMNGVSYVNDSKATNADAAGKALACYRNIYWIVGGQAKEGGLSGLDIYKNHLRHAFLIGAASDDFARWFSRWGIPYTICGTIDRAVAEAHRKAQDERGIPGGMGTVLLSPACASFDQFRNFEHRGDVFAGLVNELKESAA